MKTIISIPVGIILFLVSTLASVQAQDMEARAFSYAPVGTNFIALGYNYSSGNISPDPSIPVTDIDAKINTTTAGYARFFNLGGRTANASIGIPYFDANISGNVGEEREEIERIGLGDIKFRIGSNILGAPALTPQEFAKRTPSHTLGVSATITAPTGEYTSRRVINIGANRWAFKPEIGITQPLGNWFMEESLGVALFADNDNFFGGTQRSQDPITSVQFHGGYNFSPGMWLAFDATYWEGGQTKVNGESKNDRQSSSRYGLTFSAPVSQSLSVKLSWSNGYTTRVGGDFDTVLAVLQYRWFDK